MTYKSFSEMSRCFRAEKTRRKCAVVCADSIHVLEAVSMARNDELIEPLLIGDESGIQAEIKKLGINFEKTKIIPTRTREEAAKIAVELVSSGKADMLMKGRVDTSMLMSAVLGNKGMLRARIMSVLAILEVPYYHKLLFHTDPGLNMYPDLKQKKFIIENATVAMTSMGILNPKVAVLTAVEKANTKMPEVMDSKALKEMNERGEIKGCIIEGPISYDIAISKQVAELKGFESPVAGDADMLVWPNITVGNIAGKAIMASPGVKAAACILGSRVPIAMSSRGSYADQKYWGIVMAAGIEV